MTNTKTIAVSLEAWKFFKQQQLDKGLPTLIETIDNYIGKKKNNPTQPTEPRTIEDDWPPQ